MFWVRLLHFLSAFGTVFIKEILVGYPIHPWVFPWKQASYKQFAGATWTGSECENCAGWRQALWEAWWNPELDHGSSEIWVLAGNSTKAKQQGFVQIFLVGAAIGQCTVQTESRAFPWRAFKAFAVVGIFAFLTVAYYLATSKAGLSKLEQMQQQSHSNRGCFYCYLQRRKDDT